MLKLLSTIVPDVQEKVLIDHVSEPACREGAGTPRLPVRLYTLRKKPVFGLYENATKNCPKNTQK